MIWLFHIEMLQNIYKYTCGYLILASGAAALNTHTPAALVDRTLQPDSMVSEGNKAAAHQPATGKTCLTPLSSQVSTGRDSTAPWIQLLYTTSTFHPLFQMMMQCEKEDPSYFVMEFSRNYSPLDTLFAP